MIFEKLCFFEFYNYTNDRIFKHHLLGQEDRCKCIIWVRTWLRAHTVPITINLKNEILVFLIETFGGGTISARAQARARPYGARQLIFLNKEIIFECLIVIVALKLVTVGQIEVKVKPSKIGGYVKFLKFEKIHQFHNFFQ